MIVIVFGDLRAETVQQEMHVGRSTFNTLFDVRPDALEPQAMTILQEAPGLVALNTCMGQAKPTQLNSISHPTGRMAETKSASFSLNKQQPKHVAVRPHPSGRWRQHIRHHSLETTVRRMNHHFFPIKQIEIQKLCTQALDEVARGCQKEERGN